MGLIICAYGLVNCARDLTVCTWGFAHIIFVPQTHAINLWFNNNNHKKKFCKYQFMSVLDGFSWGIHSSIFSFRFIAKCWVVGSTGAVPTLRARGRKYIMYRLRVHRRSHTYTPMLCHTFCTVWSSDHSSPLGRKLEVEKSLFKVSLVQVYLWIQVS